MGKPLITLKTHLFLIDAGTVLNVEVKEDRREFLQAKFECLRRPSREQLEEEVKFMRQRLRYL